MWLHPILQVYYKKLHLYNIYKVSEIEKKTDILHVACGYSKKRKKYWLFIQHLFQEKNIWFLIRV